MRRLRAGAEEAEEEGLLVVGLDGGRERVEGGLELRLGLRLQLGGLGLRTFGALGADEGGLVVERVGPLDLDDGQRRRRPREVRFGARPLPGAFGLALRRRERAE